MGRRKIPTVLPSKLAAPPVELPGGASRIGMRPALAADAAMIYQFARDMAPILEITECTLEQFEQALTSCTMEPLLVELHISLLEVLIRQQEGVTKEEYAKCLQLGELRGKGVKRIHGIHAGSWTYKLLEYAERREGREITTARRRTTIITSGACPEESIDATRLLCCRAIVQALLAEPTSAPFRRRPMSNGMHGVDWEEYLQSVKNPSNLDTILERLNEEYVAATSTSGSVEGVENAANESAAYTTSGEDATSAASCGCKDFFGILRIELQLLWDNVTAFSESEDSDAAASAKAQAALFEDLILVIKDARLSGALTSSRPSASPVPTPTALASSAHRQKAKRRRGHGRGRSSGRGRTTPTPRKSCSTRVDTSKKSGGKLASRGKVGRGRGRGGRGRGRGRKGHRRAASATVSSTAKRKRGRSSGATVAPRQGRRKRKRQTEEESKADDFDGSDCSSESDDPFLELEYSSDDTGGNSGDEVCTSTAQTSAGRIPYIAPGEISWMGPLSQQAAHAISKLGCSEYDTLDTEERLAILRWLVDDAVQTDEIRHRIEDLNRECFRLRRLLDKIESEQDAEAAEFEEEESEDCSEEEDYAGGGRAQRAVAARNGSKRDAAPSSDQDDSADDVGNGDDEGCRECGRGDDEEDLLLCDECDSEWHLSCVGLEAVPEGNWSCPLCQKREASLRRSRRSTVSKGHDCASNPKPLGGEETQASEMDETDTTAIEARARRELFLQNTKERQARAQTAQSRLDKINDLTGHRKPVGVDEDAGFVRYWSLGNSRMVVENPFAELWQEYSVVIEEDHEHVLASLPALEDEEVDHNCSKRKFREAVSSTMNAIRARFDGTGTEPQQVLRWHVSNQVQRRCVPRAMRLSPGVAADQTFGRVEFLRQTLLRIEGNLLPVFNSSYRDCKSFIGDPSISLRSLVLMRKHNSLPTSDVAGVPSIVRGRSQWLVLVKTVGLVPHHMRSRLQQVLSKKTTPVSEQNSGAEVSTLQQPLDVREVSSSDSATHEEDESACGKLQKRLSCSKTECREDSTVCGPDDAEDADRAESSEVEHLCPQAGAEGEEVFALGCESTEYVIEAFNIALLQLETELLEGVASLQSPLALPTRDEQESRVQQRTLDGESDHGNSQDSIAVVSVVAEADEGGLTASNGTRIEALDPAPVNTDIKKTTNDAVAESIGSSSVLSAGDASSTRSISAGNVTRSSSCIPESRRFASLPSIPSWPAQPAQEWFMMFDTRTGREFFYNSGDHSSRWELPHGARLSVYRTPNEALEARKAGTHPWYEGSSSANHRQEDQMFEANPQPQQQLRTASSALSVSPFDLAVQPQDVSRFLADWLPERARWRASVRDATTCGEVLALACQLEQVSAGLRAITAEAFFRCRLENERARNHKKISQWALWPELKENQVVQYDRLNHSRILQAAHIAADKRRGYCVECLLNAKRRELAKVISEDRAGSLAVGSGAWMGDEPPRVGPAKLDLVVQKVEYFAGGGEPYSVVTLSPPEPVRIDRSGSSREPYMGRKRLLNTPCKEPYCPEFALQGNYSYCEHHRRPNERAPKKTAVVTPEAEQEVVHDDECYICKGVGELLLCEHAGCTRVYHTVCVRIDQMPEGEWFCPLHDTKAGAETPDVANDAKLPASLTAPKLLELLDRIFALPEPESTLKDIDTALVDHQRDAVDTAGKGLSNINTPTFSNLRWRVLLHEFQTVDDFEREAFAVCDSCISLPGNEIIEDGGADMVRPKNGESVIAEAGCKSNVTGKSATPRSKKKRKGSRTPIHRRPDPYAMERKFCTRVRNSLRIQLRKMRKRVDAERKAFVASCATNLNSAGDPNTKYGNEGKGGNSTKESLAQANATSVDDVLVSQSDAAQLDESCDDEADHEPKVEARRSSRAAALAVGSMNEDGLIDSMMQGGSSILDSNGGKQEIDRIAEEWAEEGRILHGCYGQRFQTMCTVGGIAMAASASSSYPQMRLIHRWSWSVRDGFATIKSFDASSNKKLWSNRGARIREMRELARIERQRAERLAEMQRRQIEEQKRKHYEQMRQRQLQVEHMRRQVHQQRMSEASQRRLLAERHAEVLASIAAQQAQGLQGIGGVQTGQHQFNFELNANANLGNLVPAELHAYHAWGDILRTEHRKSMMKTRASKAAAKKKSEAELKRLLRLEKATQLENQRRNKHIKKEVGTLLKSMVRSVAERAHKEIAEQKRELRAQAKLEAERARQQAKQAREEARQEARQAKQEASARRKVENIKKRAEELQQQRLQKRANLEAHLSTIRRKQGDLIFMSADHPQRLREVGRIEQEKRAFEEEARKTEHQLMRMDGALGKRQSERRHMSTFGKTLSQAYSALKLPLPTTTRDDEESCLGSDSSKTTSTVWSVADESEVARFVLDHMLTVLDYVGESEGRSRQANVTLRLGGSIFHPPRTVRYSRGFLPPSQRLVASFRERGFLQGNIVQVRWGGYFWKATITGRINIPVLESESSLAGGDDGLSSTSATQTIYGVKYFYDGTCEEGVSAGRVRPFRSFKKRTTNELEVGAQVVVASRGRLRRACIFSPHVSNLADEVSVRYSEGEDQSAAGAAGTLAVEIASEGSRSIEHKVNKVRVQCLSNAQSVAAPGISDTFMLKRGALDKSNARGAGQDAKERPAKRIRVRLVLDGLTVDPVGQPSLIATMSSQRPMKKILSGDRKNRSKSSKTGYASRFAFFSISQRVEVLRAGKWQLATIANVLEDERANSLLSFDGRPDFRALVYWVVLDGGDGEEVGGFNHDRVRALRKDRDGVAWPNLDLPRLKEGRRVVVDYEGEAWNAVISRSSRSHGNACRQRSAFFGMPWYSVIYPDDGGSVEHTVLACRIVPHEV